MIRLAVLLLYLCAVPALAQTVKVSSGEHDGFTRLVLEFGRTVDWQFGRDTDGYLLRVAGAAPEYDLSRAFEIIGRTRLAAIAHDGKGDDLHVSLACACHAIPFEFRPGIVVIDLKDGPPPSNSSFEEPLAISTAKSAETPEPPVLPNSTKGRDARYDWVAAARFGDEGHVDPSQEAVAEPPLLLLDPDLQPLRDRLIGQMARGASQGLIEMAEPNAQNLGDAGGGHASANIRIGDAPTRVDQPGGPLHGNLGAQGTECILPESLAIAAWAEPATPVAHQLAELRRNLTGEFDRTEQEQVVRYIKFLLHIGFGAEARQMIATFQPEDEDTQIWTALGHILDDEEDPAHRFRDQAACSGPAALWAVLSEDLAKGDPFDDRAVRRAFSELPLSLRRHLGPRLADRLLALGHPDAARAIRDAVSRAQDKPDLAVDLMQAQLDLQTGQADRAEEIARNLAQGEGADQPKVLIALVEARVAQRQPISADIALILQSVLAEHQGTDLAPRLADALVLAQAASGDFESAFNAMPSNKAPRQGVWSLLAALAPDSDFLTHAVISPEEELPDLPEDLRLEIARRLASLGLAGPADRWAAHSRQADPLMLAEIALGRQDARNALVHLAGLEGDDATELKLEALDRIGENALRAELLADLDQSERASAALARGANWEGLAASGSEPWKALASLAIAGPVPEEGAGPLARGAALAAAAPQTAEAIKSLLAAVPAPALAANPAN